MPRWAQYAAVAAVMALAVAADLSSPDANASNAVNYTYDAWGRVTGATYQGSGNLTTGYTYDQAGNRTQIATSAAPIANPVVQTVAASSSSNLTPLSVSGPYASVTVHTGASHGTATATGATIKYTPTSGYTGADSFTYTATNSSGTSAAATVQVVVAPVANSASKTVAYGSSNNPITYTVTGSYASVALASRPASGQATASGTSLTYTPNAGYFGSDSFQYVAVISVATSPPATVSITVNPQPPVAGNVSDTVYVDSTNNLVPLNITGGAPTSVTVATPASHGTATASGTTIHYTPVTSYGGPDSFTYTASNAGGTSSPATASISVVMTATISAPLNCPAPGPYTYVCATGLGGSHTFTGYSANSSVTGGSGSYTYLWSYTGGHGATWTTGQTTTSVTPSVSNVDLGYSRATYTVTVTDTVTHLQATSNGIAYLWTNTN
jgi:hypothetical protein